MDLSGCELNGENMLFSHGACQACTAQGRSTQRIHISIQAPGPQPQSWLVGADVRRQEHDGKASQLLHGEIPYFIKGMIDAH